MTNSYLLNINCNDPSFGLPLAANAVGRAVASSLAGFAPSGLPGFLPPDAGTFATYRQISAHPTVALVMGIVIDPIMAGSWGWMKRADAPEQWLAFARDILQPMRSDILKQGLRALAFGFAAFEKVWMAQGDRIVLQNLKPLLPEMTQILVDGHGNFAGLRNQAAGEPPRDLPAAKSFLYTNDLEAADFYGRSRHENIRVTFSQAMQTAQRLAMYQKKIAGVIAQLHYPEGVSRDAAGVERSNDVIAQQILEAVSMGKSVRFPNLFASIDDPVSAANLAGKSQWVLSQFDPGGTDHSEGLLNALAYYDRLLFRGWIRPERVGLEAQHGTRADAEQHSETSVLDSELIDRDFSTAFNRGVVDELLAINFGQQARGSVWIEPAPISDTKADTAKSVLMALLGKNGTGAVADRIDVQSLLADLEIPVLSISPG